jgi:hypothetical protein
MMKSIALSCAFMAAGSMWAAAQDRVIVDERPAVTVPVPGVTVEKRDRPVIEKKEVETTGRGGCDSKTVRREGPEGSTTVKKERCN